MVQTKPFDAAKPNCFISIIAIWQASKTKPISFQLCVTNLWQPRMIPFLLHLEKTIFSHSTDCRASKFNRYQFQPFHTRVPIEQPDSFEVIERYHVALLNLSTASYLNQQRTLSSIDCVLKGPPCPAMVDDDNIFKHTCSTDSVLIPRWDRTSTTVLVVDGPSDA